MGARHYIQYASGLQIQYGGQKVLRTAFHNAPMTDASAAADMEQKQEWQQQYRNVGMKMSPNCWEGVVVGYR